MWTGGENRFEMKIVWVIKKSGRKEKQGGLRKKKRETVPQARD